jgi:death on curing protein
VNRKEPIWLSAAVLIAAHRILITEHGGAPGIRARGLLESALARPRHLLRYGNPNMFDMAAAYAAGLAHNHPFVDGNKRAAFMAAFIFLSRNGYEPRMTEPETVLVMRRLAAGELTEDQLALWFSQNCQRRRRAVKRNPR